MMVSPTGFEPVLPPCKSRKVLEEQVTRSQEPGHLMEMSGMVGEG